MTATNDDIEAVARAIYDLENGIDGDTIATMLHENFRIEGDTVEAQLAQVMNVCAIVSKAAIAALEARGWQKVPEGCVIVPFIRMTKIVDGYENCASALYSMAKDTRRRDACGKEVAEFRAMIGAKN